MAQNRMASDIRLSDQARQQIVDAIQISRLQKQGRLDAGDVLTPKPGLFLNAGDQNIRISTDTIYTSLYFDTLPGNAFSFPEDTHDFCRASFGDANANQDYTLDLLLEGGAVLDIRLEWTDNPSEITDYDIYLFDVNGKTVGDPTGIFPSGENGTEFQFEGDARIENANVLHNGSNEGLFIVVDRFRGEGNGALQISVTGEDSLYSVLQYNVDDSFSYLDAVTDLFIGALTDASVINLDRLGSPRPNFAIEFNTDDCAESIHFELVNAGTGETIAETDDGLPYALFGDIDGDFTPGDLANGSYTLTGTPYSGDGRSGVANSATTVSFQIVSDGPPAFDFDLTAEQRTTDELILLDFLISASDPSGGIITYSLDDASADLGMQIDGATGAFSWTPSEAQGPGNYEVTYTALGGGGASSDTTITLTVNEVNAAPSLSPIEAQAVALGDSVRFEAQATDPDIPANTLLYSLEGEQPGMSIDENTGTFRWLPTELGNFLVTVTVSDDGMPPLNTSVQANISVAPDTARIVSFSLVGTDPDRPMDSLVVDIPITNGDIIDLTTLSRAFDINIRANIEDPGGLTQSVAFDAIITKSGFFKEQLTSVDSAQPFDLFEANNGMDFTAIDMVSVGMYTTSAAPVGGSEIDPSRLIGNSVQFTLLGPRVANYTLIDADSDQPIVGYDPIVENDTLNLSVLPPNLNIRANTVDFDSTAIESMAFLMVSPGAPDPISDRTESYRPYSVFGDCIPNTPCNTDIDPPVTPDYDIWQSPFAGAFTLTGITLPDAGIEADTLILNFTMELGNTSQPVQLVNDAKLLPNYPNPFNPITTIRFDIPEAMPVRLEVYDMLGRVVSVLVDGDLSPGTHEVSFDAGTLSSGMYIYRLETLNNTVVRFMTLLK